MSKLPSKLSPTTNANAWKDLKKTHKLAPKVDSGLESALADLDNHLQTFNPDLVKHGYTVFANSLSTIGDATDAVIKSANSASKHPALPAPVLDFLKKIVIVAQAIAKGAIDEKAALGQTVTNAEKSYKRFFELRAGLAKLLDKGHGEVGAALEKIKKNAGTLSTYFAGIKAGKVSDDKLDATCIAMGKIAVEGRTIATGAKNYYDQQIAPPFHHQRTGDRRGVKKDAGVDTADLTLNARIDKEDTGKFDKIMSVHFNILGLFKQIDDSVAAMDQTVDAAIAAIAARRQQEGLAQGATKNALLVAHTKIEDIHKEVDVYMKNLDPDRQYKASTDGAVAAVKAKKKPAEIIKICEDALQGIINRFTEPLDKVPLIQKRLKDAGDLYKKTLSEVTISIRSDIKPLIQRLMDAEKTTNKLTKDVADLNNKMISQRKKAEELLKKTLQEAKKKA